MADNAKSFPPDRPSFVGKLSNAEPVNSSSEFEKVREQLHEWATAAYEAWKSDVESWQIIRFDSAKEREEAVAGGKWAAKTVPTGPLTMSVKPDDDDKVLVYRFRDKISRGRKGKPDTGNAASDADNDTAGHVDVPATDNTGTGTVKGE